MNTSEFVRSAADAASHISLFDETLTEARETFPDYDWLIVKHHKSMHSVAEHLADPDIQYFVEAGFDGVMDMHEVDVVIAGHDHVYARSHVMKGGEIAARETYGFIQGGRGTIYMTLTSPSGQKYYDVFLPYDRLFYNLMAPMFGREPGHNTEFPLLADGTWGTQNYSDHEILPMSVHIYQQNHKPGYAIFNVNGSSSLDVAVFSTDNPGLAFDSFKINK